MRDVGSRLFFTWDVLLVGFVAISFCLTGCIHRRNDIPHSSTFTLLTLVARTKAFDGPDSMMLHTRNMTNPMPED